MSHRYLGSILSSQEITVTNTQASGKFTLVQHFNQVSSNNAWPRLIRPVVVSYLIVAGGGGGGATGSGAGAGGLLQGSKTIYTNSTYNITVGGGGAGGIANNTWTGSQGSNSVFDDITTYGGGAGYSHGGTFGGNGGSGGGAPQRTDGSTTPGRGVYPGSSYVNAARQGYDGGPGSINGSWGGISGGGGGAGGAGGNGPGGVGLQLTEYASMGGSPAGWFAGGGGAGEIYASPGAGGTGGGAGGGTGDYGGGNGTANTGGGAGGGGFYPYTNGGTGGSGIVIIKVLSSESDVVLSGSPTITTSGGYTYYKYTQSGSIKFM
jgi:hypothetical protein